MPVNQFQAQNPDDEAVPIAPRTGDLNRDRTENWDFLTIADDGEGFIGALPPPEAIHTRAWRFSDSFVGTLVSPGILLVQYQGE